MFDRVVLAGMSEEVLISALVAATRSEAMAAAERLALVAEVTARECDDEDDVSAHQVIDGWAFARSQVGAACNLGTHAASTQMRIGVALRDRLPRTAALFASGAVSAKVVGEITWRTKLVTDEDALALIDAAIAGEATDYGTLSEAALTRAVDFWVAKFDPIAVIQSTAAAKDRYVEFGDRDDPNGVCSFWGRLRITDKEAIEQRLNDLAATVCANDPRAVRERRADAMGALGIVGPSLERLACLCGDPECVGSGKDPRSAAVTIYVLADQVPGSGARPASEPGPGPGPGPLPTPGPEGTCGPWPGSGPAPTETESEPTPGPAPEPDVPESEPSPEPAHEPDAPETRPAAHTPAATTPPAAPETRPAAHTPAPAAAPTPPAATFPGAGTGVMLDGAVIPAALLAELVATGAKVRPLSEVADLPTERQYRPSTALTAFVRMRSMTCSFPGCSKPAHRCDLDHVTPWPAGATHPGNLRPLCREHHLLKTFRTGPGGWTITAHPDGRSEWAAPTGHTYVTRPGAAVLFPQWNIHTTVPPPRPITLLHDDHRGAMMPTRQRTRAQDREYRINAERVRNATELALAHVRAGDIVAQRGAVNDGFFNGPVPNDSVTNDSVPNDSVTNDSVPNDGDPPPF